MKFKDIDEMSLKEVDELTSTSTYKEYFDKADIVICSNRGIYKFLKKPYEIKPKYLPHGDVIKFLELKDIKVMYCDHLENVIECNF